MPVLGIVAEYDPFHNGHLRHLRETAAIAPSSVLVALSGPFKQRGEAALLSPFGRAECALSAGADAVFSLPVLWTVRDAEHYALGAVHLLSSLGADHLAFGAETADLALLQKTADLLEDSPAALQNALHEYLSEGYGWPAALARAAGKCLSEGTEVLNHPNNILAVCYLRAIRRLGVSMEPVVIPRSGVYRTERILPGAPSAIALRDALRRGAWQDALSSLPYSSEKVVRTAFLSGRIPDSGRLDTMLLNKLRAMTREEAAELPGCQEGLDRSLLKAAASASSREELLALLTTRRYPAARLSRLCTYALLGVTQKMLENAPLPDRALLLALKKNPSLTGCWKDISVRVCNASEWLSSADPVEKTAWRLWSLASGYTDSWPFSQKLTVR